MQLGCCCPKEPNLPFHISKRFLCGWYFMSRYSRYMFLPSAMFLHLSRGGGSVMMSLPVMDSDPPGQHHPTWTVPPPWTAPTCPHSSIPGLHHLDNTPPPPTAPLDSTHPRQHLPPLDSSIPGQQHSWTAASLDSSIPEHHPLQLSGIISCNYDLSFSIRSRRSFLLCLIWRMIPTERKKSELSRRDQLINLLICF